MVVYNLDGELIKWNYSKYYSRKSNQNKSKWHLQARGLLKEIFPNSTIYEEVTLPTKPATYADFFVPNHTLIVEVNGEQHYEFNSHFHKDKMAFYRGLARDKMKREWCKINDFSIVELPYNEVDEWTKMIKNSILQ